MNDIIIDDGDIKVGQFAKLDISFELIIPIIIPIIPPDILNAIASVKN